MTSLHPHLNRILLGPEQIQHRVRELAHQLQEDYKDAEDFLLIGILKGAFVFLADLTRQLSIPHAVDFMAISSYGKGATTGAVRILMDLREPIERKHVLIVEDIVDSGNTLNYLLATLRGRNPASLKSCVLVQKERDGVDTSIDYLGFTIPDVWVVGYGLDFAETFRTLPYIAELKKDIYS